MSQHVAVESMKDCQQEVDNKKHSEMLADGTPFHGQECLAKGMTQQLVVTPFGHLLENLYLTSLTGKMNQIRKELLVSGWVPYMMLSRLTCLPFASH